MDLELLHKIWLQITSDPRYAGLHHYHVIGLALEELQRNLSTAQREDLLNELRREMHDSLR